MISLSDSAVSLWVRAGAYSCQHLTDGYISQQVLRVLHGVDEVVDELVQMELWKQVDGGWVFHDWGEFQETSEAVKTRRERAKERMRKARAAKGSASECSREQPENVRANFARSSHNPDPTRPIKEKNVQADFEAWWNEYPRKVGKKAAETAYRRALKDVDSSVLVTAAKAYAKANADTDQKFIALPTTWLNQGRWDEFDTATSDPEALLRECWQAGRIGKITELTGWKAPIFRHPEDPSVDKEIALRDHYRRVIEDNRSELIQRLKEVS